MRNIIKYSGVVVLLGLTLVLSDCKKNKFLNVNNNPNYPATVTVNLQLPTTEANIGYVMSNQLNIYGGIWAQYWTQDPTYGSQYGNYDAYVNVPTDNDIVWSSVYTTATNLNLIIANADSTQKNYAAIAYFMKAYLFQVINDGWDDVPVSQALKGGSGVVDPTYDKGPQIYDSLVVWINDGLKIIDNTRTSPAEDLIYPNASMTQWQKFANTLLLKIYLRESGVPATAAVAKAGIQSLQGASFISAPTSPSGDDAMLHYIAVTYQQFPLYATGLFLSVRNITGSATAVNYLLQTSDPRLTDFYSLDAAGGYGGELQGDWRNLSGSTDATFSPPNLTEIISPTASQRFITASESDFLQAEAIARGYMSGSASSMYYAGINASLASWANSSSASPAAIATFLANDSVNFSLASNMQTQLQYILTQKWVSMCGNQNFEAWCEWRRTGYPDFFTPSLSNLQGPGLWPLRLVYPSAEEEENTNFPPSGVVPIYTPVWWGKNI